MNELDSLRGRERWIAKVRLLGVPFAVVEVGLISTGYPPGYELRAWIVTAALAVGAVAVWFLARQELELRAQKLLGLAALALDTGVIGAYVVIYYAYEPDSPVRQIMMLPVVEGAVRYGVAGALVIPVVLAPFLAWGEALRSDRYDRSFSVDAITLPFGIEILVGLIVAWLAMRLRQEAVTAESRAAEAEELRDRLGRRADQLEAVNQSRPGPRVVSRPGGGLEPLPRGGDERFRLRPARDRPRGGGRRLRDGKRRSRPREALSRRDVAPRRELCPAGHSRGRPDHRSRGHEGEPAVSGGARARGHRSAVARRRAPAGWRLDPRHAVGLAGSGGRLQR
jgi:hypothetical protein